MDEASTITSAGPESSMYSIEEAEQGEVFEPTVAVARKVVVESSATETVRPGDANAAALPRATGGPLQPGVV